MLERNGAADKHDDVLRNFLARLNGVEIGVVQHRDAALEFKESQFLGLVRRLLAHSRDERVAELLPQPLQFLRVSQMFFKCGVNHCRYSLLRQPFIL